MVCPKIGLHAWEACSFQAGRKGNASSAGLAGREGVVMAGREGVVKKATPGCRWRWCSRAAAAAAAAAAAEEEEEEEEECKKIVLRHGRE